MNENFKEYRRKGTVLLRPYIIGEDLSKVSVSQADKDSGYLSTEGNYIAINKDNQEDQWFINSDFFNKNYELN